MEKRGDISEEHTPKDLKTGSIDKNASTKLQDGVKQASRDVRPPKAEKGI